MIRTAGSQNMDNRRIGENKEPTAQLLQGSDKIVDRLVQFIQKAHRINIV
jgi:HKD family nuclease